MPIEHINSDLCNGCRLCIDTCPMDVFRLDTFVVDRDEFPPCRLACPAGVDIRSYLYLLREGMFEEAIDILRESLPFPAVTGRVCQHPCEAECARKEVDEAVNINALERFVADYFLNEKAKPVHKIYAAKTAVIGSGPAGLSCAYFLTRMGYPVTVFEAMPELGGMLRVGIPEFRLPKDVLDAQINYIRDMGVEFKTGVNIGKQISFDNLKKDFQAVFCATGNHLSRSLELEGIEFEGVVQGIDFLLDLNLKRQIKTKEKIVIVGGGNVAIDIALATLRLGAKEVQLVCLESVESMPAYKEGIKQATDEGVVINASWGPKKILGIGRRVTGIELARCISIFDKEGNFNPSFNDKQTRTLETDMVILAIGQIPDLSFVAEGMKITEKGTIQVDPITQETTLSGIFAGGDVVSGAVSVVEAIASGRSAAISIDRYLKIQDLKEGRYLNPNRVRNPPKEGVAKMARQRTPLLPIEQRHEDFKEVKVGFNQDLTNLEAQRCMTCGSRALIKYPEDCQLCYYCETDCPQKAIYVSPEKKELPMLAWS